MSNLKRPWFKFYAQDWSADPDLRLCSLEAKGLLADLMAMAHAGNPYGYVTNGGKLLNDSEIAKLCGEPQAKVQNILVELLEHTRIGKSESGYFIPRMVRDGQRHLQQQEFGTLGGNPKIAIEKKSHEKERDELAAKLSPAMVDLWETWCADRKKRGRPMTIFAEILQLRKITEWGESRATLAIQTAIERGWRGLFLPQEETATAKPRPQGKNLVSRDDVVHRSVELLWKVKDNDTEFKRSLSVLRDKYFKEYGKNSKGETIIEEIMEIIKWRRSQKWK